eukprot:2516255-Heterocapsa_arctica.AAC.1
MTAGALHSIITDGAWTPQRAEKCTHNVDGRCLLCGGINAGVDHIWWECPALNSIADLGL